MTGSSQVQDGPDLTGKLVRWESDGQWLTARVERRGVAPGTWEGAVVDPGNYIGLSRYAPKETRRAGDWLPNLRSDLITVIDEQSATGMGHPDEHDELCEETGCRSEIDGGEEVRRA